MAGIANASGTLRVLAALLAYPDAAMRGHLGQMREVVREERSLGPAHREALDAFMARLELADPLDVEAEYVALFDCGRATSLHLFEHVHGDSRDRGPAMVDLARTYEAAGLHLAPGELPDYLPVALEFASTQPPAVAREFLAEIAPVVNGIFNAVQERASHHAVVLAALLEIAGEKPRAVGTQAEQSLDETWAEPPAFGGCPAGAGPQAGRPQPIHVVRRNAKPGVVA